jgi:exodeoxyribonuclease VII large subunit
MTQNAFTANGLPVYTPSELIRSVNHWLDREYARVVVEGEISSVRQSGRGHMYFDLRDSSAVLHCVLFAGERRMLSITPTEGLKVQATGQLSVYPAQGNFQLRVESLKDAGEGELLRAFLALKARLEAEGLFDEARKPRLPKWPKRLALLTSREGAVLHDVLTILARRFPLLPIDFHPVPVQGRDAAGKIIAALRRVIAGGRCDLVLIARGGGSLTDLSAFNDEALARAIAASPLPVVSAIGHETDFTIADFVAALRAPTPSAAAELIAPDRSELLARIQRIGQFLRREMLDRLRTRQQRLDERERILRAFAPAHGPLAASLAHRRAQLISAWREGLAARRRRLEPIRARLLHRRGQLLRHSEAALARCGERLHRVAPHPRLSTEASKLRALRSRLASPLPAQWAQLERLRSRLREAHPRRRLDRWRQRLAPLPLRLLRAVEQRLARPRRSLTAAREALLRREPRLELLALRARLQRSAFRLERKATALLAPHAERLRRIRPANLQTALGERLGEDKTRLATQREVLLEASRDRLARLTHRVEQAALALKRLGPEGTLRRGYAILMSAEGQVLARAAQAFPGQPLAAILIDGRLGLRVERVLSSPPPEESS